jgi:hypothetical protein
MSQFGNEIKQWLETNDMPSQEQFAIWVDRTRLKDEVIEFTDMSQTFIELINGLGSPIQNFDAEGYWEYIIPAGYLVEWFIIKPSSYANISYGIDGNQIAADVEADETGISIEGLRIAFNDRVFYIDNLPIKTTVWVKRYKLP